MQIRLTEQLLDSNTLRLPAQAEAFASAHGERDLLRAMDWARARGLAVMPLGQGSNVVFAGDLQALVVRQCNADIQVLAQQESWVTLRVSAGHDWHALVCRCLDMGFFGLENLALIPGTVGAAPIQNIGAYGVELEQFVEAVHCLYIDTGEPVVLTGKECEFAYRNSIFKHELRDRVIVTAVDFRLSREPLCNVQYPALQRALAARHITTPSPRDVFSAVVSVRRERLPDPAQYPNAGSFFHNPVVTGAQARDLAEQWPDMPLYPQAHDTVKLPAAWLIERAGWKGRRDGDVGVYPEHALVLVNFGAASGAALLEFARHIQQAVAAMFKVQLNIEPRVYGAPV
ncbi:UDP-N-acetylmuramate dehydrogenase [Pseudohalioglobus sediminis]|uniref:UDP-N-acetylmuramate dehydrogenase n=1 Tax=Pseudohalioglobus sediminis TaxID=2606449 RepID=UPI00165FB7C1|nr:UDP-N-acetylmuramate dehydrogenase [Pseudohalioglobus sediminis]